MRADIALKLLYFFAQTEPVYTLNQNNSYGDWRVILGGRDEFCEVYVRANIKPNQEIPATIVCRDEGSDLINSWQDVAIK